MKEILQNNLSDICLSLVCRTLAKHNKTLNDVEQFAFGGNYLTLLVRNAKAGFDCISIDLSTGEE